MNFNSMNDFFKDPLYENYDPTNNILNLKLTKDLYQNTRGVNTPKSYMVVLDSRAISSDAVANNFVYNKVVFNLCDPIIIDSPTDVYLEFLHFQNTDVSDASGTEITAHLEQTSQFYIDIDEFAIRNISNNQLQSAKFFIPNNVYGKTDRNQNDDDTNTKTTFIKLKSHYLCRMEANYINKLTLTIRAESTNGSDGSNETTLGYLSNQGSLNNTTFIEDQAGLEAWATDSNDIGILMKNIDLTPDTDPISLNDNKIFNGNGYTIKIGLNTLNGGKRFHTGLFSVDTEGYTITVKNLMINTENIDLINQYNSVLFKRFSVNNLNITVENCGCDKQTGTTTLLGDSGSIVGSFGNSSGTDIVIRNCFSTLNINGDGSGGIVGHKAGYSGGSFQIHNCFTTGHITARRAGGIIGRVASGSSYTNSIISNCYSLGNITHVTAGGIAGAETAKDGYLLISNCYSFGSFGDILNGGGGMVANLADGDNLKIENCHSVHATGTGVGNNQFIKGVASGTPTVNDSSAGNGTWTPNLGNVLIDNHTDSAGVLTDSDVWATSGGSFANGYGLTVFTQSPWDSSSYTAHNSIPTFLANEVSTNNGAVKIGLYFEKQKK